jgi:hypothetical protein
MGVTFFKVGTFEKQAYKIVLQITPGPEASLQLDFWNRKQLCYPTMFNSIYILIFCLLIKASFSSLVDIKGTHSYLAS